MQEQNKTVQVVDIQFRPGQKIYYFDPAGIPCKAGDHVIIDTARGPEYGTCVAGVHTIGSKEIVAPLRPVLRIATAQDEKVAADNHAKEKKAYEVCLQKIAEHNLDMQLVSAECAFDGSKILFFFTADGRVDFRELVKDLAGIFRNRIKKPGLSLMAGALVDYKKAAARYQVQAACRENRRAASELFKNYPGISIHQYLLIRRILIAKELIEKIWEAKE